MDDYCCKIDAIFCEVMFTQCCIFKKNNNNNLLHAILNCSLFFLGTTYFPIFKTIVVTIHTSSMTPNPSPNLSRAHARCFIKPLSLQQSSFFHCSILGSVEASQVFVCLCCKSQFEFLHLSQHKYLKIN